MYSPLLEATKSIGNQTYSDVELIIVVDGNDTICEKIQEQYANEENVIIHCNDKNRGLSASRNIGWKLATGEVVAFIDDDAVADKRWIENLINTYRERDVVSVGGPMIPDWVTGRPSYLPQEFYWLIGVTHKGFADGAQEVRNTNGSNISFQRDVLVELEGFNESLGRKGTAQIQAEETEICIRMYEKTGHRTWYNPDAKVAHKVFEYRTHPKFLFKRAFWQGYSKQVMNEMLLTDGGAEGKYLRQLLTNFIPHRIIRLFRSPSVERATQLGMLLLLTATVGMGYVYGIIR